MDKTLDKTSDKNNESIKVTINSKNIDKKERDEKIIELYNSDHTMNQIIKEVGVSSSTIYTVLKINGVELKANKQELEKRKKIEKVCFLFDTGYNLNDICNLEKLERKIVLAILNKFRYQALQDYKIKDRLSSKNKGLKDALKEEIGKDEKKSKRRKLTDIMLEREKGKGILEKTLVKFVSPSEVHFSTETVNLLEHMTGKEKKEDLTEKEKRMIDAVREYVSGKSIFEILEKYNITSEEFFNTVEASKNRKVEVYNNRPGEVGR